MKKWPRFKVDLCGSWNMIGPHNLTGSGTIRRCGFVGVGVALEEVCHCGYRF